MTDKQIIIDVCPYQGECSVSGCKRNDDGCFVRQLFEERYRAENQIVDLNKMVEAKEQECERLKKQVDDLLHKPEIQDKILWKIDNEALLGSKDAYIYKLEKTLTKIKKILLFNKKELEECLYNDIDGQILKIINEVENGI